MKKKFLAVMAALMVMGAFAACGSKDTEGAANEDTGEAVNEDTAGAVDEQAGEGMGGSEEGLKYLSDFDARNYVTLGEYKGVAVDVDVQKVTEEDLQYWIEYILSYDAETVEVTDRSVEAGDTVNIDYEGKLDGEAFQGGTAQGADLTIGSGSFIEGFEDGIIGMEIGETRNLKLSFPDPYKSNPDLAGKPVVFTVTVNSITRQEIPELTDEYVAGLGAEEYSTVEEFRNYMNDLLLEQTQTNFENEKMNAALEKAEANAVFEEVPAGMLSRMNDTLTSNIAAYAYMYGMNIGDYVAYAYGGTAETYQDVLLEQARITAQRYIMLAAIADIEGIEVTDAELEESISAEAAGYADYGYESEEAYKETIDAEAYREYLLIQRVADFLGENAVLSGGEDE